MSTLTHSPAWNALHDHRTILSGHHLRDLFEQDEDRFDKFSLLFNDILIDYSKQPINSESMTLLMTLARTIPRTERHSMSLSEERDHSIWTGSISLPRLSGF